MEFIEGESLDRVLARTGALEPRFALKVLASLLDALGAVHRTGVVHRDVKPANVMLTSGGVVLADFGIARSAESLGLTAADALMGTVPYLAPELFHAETPTPAADVYAVGILGYELLSGRQPFQAASTAAVMYMHMHEPPPPLPDYVAAPAAEVLWHALEKDPAHRWADGAEMAEAVRHVLAGPVEAGEDLGAEPGLGGRYGGYAGIPSGYEDTLTDSGGRRRRRPAARGRAAEGGYAAAGGAAGIASAAVRRRLIRRRRRRRPVRSRRGVRGERRVRLWRPARPRGLRDTRANIPALTAIPAPWRRPRTSTRCRETIPGTVPGAMPPDATRVYDERTAPMADPGGRGGHAADFPDGTRVYDLPSAMADSGGGRHAGPPTHRAATSLRSAAGAPRPTKARLTGFGGRGGGLRPDVRRKALITAAVAVPALLGLSVALAMSSSGKSPDGGAPGPGPAQQTDVPSAGTGHRRPGAADRAGAHLDQRLRAHVRAPHVTTYPSNGHSSGFGSSASATDPTSTGRSGQPTDTGSAAASSQSGLPTSGNSTSQGTSTPPSSASSYPSSSSS